MTRRTTGAPALGFCDRCIVPTPAKTIEKLTFGVGTFELRLCDPDADKFQDDMLRWSRIGTLVEDRPQTFRTPSRESQPTRRVAASYMAVPDVVASAEAGTPADLEEDMPPIVVRQRGNPEAPPWGRSAVPAELESWTFSKHALERLVERDISAAEALWCAAHPDTSEPSTSEDYPDCMVHRLGSVRVVVDPLRKSIVTVMVRDQYQEQEIKSA